jgi:hypothetical protein
MQVQHRSFPLTSQAGRVALLTGILAGVVGAQEILAAVADDVETRPRRKPVRAWDRRFPSITAAAEWARQEFRWSDPRSVAAWRQQIARLCNQDCWPGFYWEE